MTRTTHLACTCGEMKIALTGAPILSAECHCASCREAARRLGALPKAPAIAEDNGGTRFVLYRKDRVRFVSGTGALREFRLTPDAATRRAVATCCNTPVFLEFKNGHWLSLYAGLWPDGAEPPVDMRSMVSDREDPTPLSDDVPNAQTQSLSFMARLMGAWIAMGFRIPKVPVAETLNA